MNALLKKLEVPVVRITDVLVVFHAHEIYFMSSGIELRSAYCMYMNINHMFSPVAQ